MGRAGHGSSVGDTASMGLELPAWSKLAVVPASSTGSRCVGPRSAQMGAAGQGAGQ